MLRKQIVSTLSIGALLLFMLNACGGNKAKKYSGQTMGTKYNITLISETPVDQREIDSVLKAFNACLSTYDSNSSLSYFNRHDSVMVEGSELTWLSEVMQSSLLIYGYSNGAFDPSAAALFNFWGFGEDKTLEIDSTQIDSLRQFTGMRLFAWDGNVLRKLDPRATLNFNAIAKGYGVDIVSKYLEQKGVQNYMVEIGGEVRCKGQNAEGKAWTIGINVPEEKSALNSYFKAVQLKNAALATSGNYRNYKEKDGRKWSHTINPATGYPVQSDILSASILAPDCMTADGLATACMVMGKEEAMAMIEKLDNTEALFIWADEKGKLQTAMSSGMSRFSVE